MKTQYEIYLERIYELLDGIDEEAIPHIIKMIEVLAVEHKKQPRLRLVI